MISAVKIDLMRKRNNNKKVIAARSNEIALLLRGSEYSQALESIQNPTTPVVDPYFDNLIDIKTHERIRAIIQESLLEGIQTLRKYIRG